MDIVSMAVGYGFGNFNKSKDPMNYNLFDPPLVNTVMVPRNGWAAIRFVATNPGMCPTELMLDLVLKVLLQIFSYFPLIYLIVQN
jgi:hypothetical protein